MVENSNLKASPRSDGMSGLFYLLCWNIIKEPLMKVLCAIHEGNIPTASQRLSVMVFANKQKKTKLHSTNGQEEDQPP